MKEKKIRRKVCRIAYDLNEKKLQILGCYTSKIILSQKEYSEMLKMSPTTFNYYFKQLQNYGFISKESKITEKGKQVIQYFNHGDKLPPKILRAHKLQISFNVIKTPKDFWKNRNKLFNLFTNQRYRGFKTTISGCQILFYGQKKMVAFLPDILGESELEVLGLIKEEVNELKEKIESEFPGLVLSFSEIAKFESMHVAIVNSEIAKAFNTNKAYHIHGRIAIDNSNGESELEVENLHTLGEDLELICRYEDLVRENKFLKKRLEDINKKLEKEEKGKKDFINQEED